MVYIDTTKADRDLTPGVDLWEITGCDSVFSRGGDGMLKMRFERVSDPNSHLFDNIMLEGPGWGIGKAKLAALLDEGFKGELDPYDLITRRLWVHTVVDTYEGKDRLKVAIEELKHAGYQRAEDVPAGCELPAAGAGDDLDSTPF